jgi:hypothetical protein
MIAVDIRLHRERDGKLHMVSIAEFSNSHPKIASYWFIDGV